MRRIISLLLLLGLFAAGAKAQLLYKITGDSLKKPSYVVGIDRLINPQGIVQGITGIKEAMIQTDQMYFETAPDSASYLRDAYKMPSGKTLKTVLTTAQYNALNTFLKKYEGVGLESPQVQKRYGSLSPLGLRNEMEKLIFVANHMSEYDPTHTFNEYFLAQAKANTEPTYGLTPVSLQIERIKNLTLARQATLLTELVSHADACLGRLDKVADAFSRQDVNAANAAAGYDATTYADIASWANLMPGVMAKAPTLFVVEAGKLGGQKGLLQLLRDKGFSVE